MRMFITAFALCSLFALNAYSAPLDGLKNLQDKFEEVEQEFLTSEKYPYSDKHLKQWAEMWMNSFLDLEKMLLTVTDQAVYMSGKDRVCLRKEIKSDLLSIMFDRAKEATTAIRTTTRSGIHKGVPFGATILRAVILVEYDFSTDEEDDVDTVKYHVYQKPDGKWYVYDLESWGIKFSTYYRWFQLSDAKNRCGI